MLFPWSGRFDLGYRSCYLLEEESSQSINNRGVSHRKEHVQVQVIQNMQLALIMQEHLGKWGQADKKMQHSSAVGVMASVVIWSSHGILLG